MTAFLWQETNNDQWDPNDDDEEHAMTKDRCQVGLYPEHHPVLSATIIGTQQNSDNKIKARLRYSAKNVGLKEVNVHFFFRHKSHFTESTQSGNFKIVSSF